MNTKRIIIVVLAVLAAAACSGEYNPPVVPQVQKAKQIKGEYAFSGNMSDINFVKDEKLAPESYKLNISPEGITVTSSDEAGSFYALQTLLQLLPAEGGECSVPCLKIEDAPRFGYRGLMLDVSRFFMPKDYVLKVIDCMAMLKLNKLHFHLADDNGWRLEIKQYPKLTEVGAWRVDRGMTPFAARRNQKPDEKATLGGYYTQDEIREIVAYAAQRHVEVIPEIDIPAHSNAALASYPEYACPVVDQPVTVLPGLGGRSADIIFCAGNDSTYLFLQNILDEVMELFPSHYINLGGDEAGKSNWKVCPLCQERIHNEHLENEEELQGYFMERMASYVRSKGREVIGWDELTNSKLPEDVIVQGWQGTGNAALKAAAQGHRFILSPAKLLYFIRYQGPQWFEPLTYFGGGSLKDVYEYEPVGDDWPSTYEPLLMGIEGCMWTEFCYSTEDVSHLLFPRTVALAEAAWGQKGVRDWQGFLTRLDGFLPRLDSLGIAYARSMYNIQQRVAPSENEQGLTVSLECIRPDVEIRYTLDGSEPEASSSYYNGPLECPRPCVLKAATFSGGKMTGQVLELPIAYNKATAKDIQSNGSDPAVLVNGVRGSLKYTDSEWCTWPTNGDAVVTVDLGAQDQLHNLTLGIITNYGMSVHKPSSIKVEVSENNTDYVQAASRSFSSEEIFVEGETFIEDISFDLSGTDGRYVRITMAAPGPCPDDHVRPGRPASVYVDEIIID